MNKKYIIRKNEDILEIIKKGVRINFKNLYIYRKKNVLDYNRYCISVSKKLGNAVIRNKLRRQVKDIIMKNNFKNSYDYVIILSSSFKELDFEKKKEAIINALEEKK